MLSASSGVMGTAMTCSTGPEGFVDCIITADQKLVGFTPRLSYKYKRGVDVFDAMCFSIAT